MSVKELITRLSPTAALFLFSLDKYYGRSSIFYGIPKIIIQIIWSCCAWSVSTAAAGSKKIGCFRDS